MKEKNISLFEALYKESPAKPKDSKIKQILEQTTNEVWSYARIGEYRKPGAGIPKRYFSIFYHALLVPKNKAKEILFDWYVNKINS